MTSAADGVVTAGVATAIASVAAAMAVAGIGTVGVAMAAAATPRLMRCARREPLRSARLLRHLRRHLTAVAAAGVVGAAIAVAAMVQRAKVVKHASRDHPVPRAAAKPLPPT